MTEQETERTTQDEDPEVTVAKFMAYRREQRRKKKSAHLVTWLIGLVPAYFVWESELYLTVFDWLGLAEAANQELALLTAHVFTASVTWSIAVILLFPLRWHLRARWSVDKEQYGLGDNGDSENENRDGDGAEQHGRTPQ